MKAHHVISRIPGNTAADPHHADVLGRFTQKLTRALAKLKRRLQGHYERAHPTQTELVRRAIAEAEACAWELSPFPHLFLPDLVEVRIAALVASQLACSHSEAALHPSRMTLTPHTEQLTQALRPR